jgi:hypothetical protein
MYHIHAYSGTSLPHNKKRAQASSPRSPFSKTKN